MRVVQTAIFDLDGTIADTLPLIYAAMDTAFFPAIGRRLPDAEIRALFGPPDNHIIRAMVGDERWAAAFDRYVQTYERDHQQHVAVFPGVREVIRAAQAAGVRLGVVTGKSRQTALFSLAALDLLDAFAVIYAGDDVARQKPDPEAVIKILIDLRHRPGDSGLFIGDSAADVEAGRAAGLTTVGVTWGNPDHADLEASRPDVIVHTAAELGEALGLPQPA